MAVGLALTAHRKSIIFRREFPQLKDIIQRSRDILTDTLATYNSQDHMWRGIPGGRTLEFGSMQYADDWTRYKGRPHDLKAYDELTEFLEMQYLASIGWARTTTPGQRVRIIGMTNPPTNAEGEWVIRRWGPWLDPQHSHPAEPGELRWYAMIEGKEVARENGDTFLWKNETIQPKSRTFIPARLSDNPFLRDTGYVATLQSMPEPLRSQLLYGDFTVGLGDHRWQIIPTDWIRQAQARWKSDGGQGKPLSAIGVDVARGGDDKTATSKRYGNWYAPIAKVPGKETPDGPSVAACVISALQGQTPPTINVDVIGVGSSAYDHLRGLYQQKVQAVNFASGSNATDKSGQLGFVNVRAEDYWRMREALDPNSGQDLALPPDPELLADLCAARWKLTPRGIQVEEKEEIRKRLGRSPDCGDALVLATHEQTNFAGIWGR